MAQSFVTDAGTLIIPGAYPTIKVQTASSGLAATGVVMLVGEADAGPRFDAEADLAQNAFGPDQLAAVVAKYKSGPIVDGFRAVVNAPNDPNLQGAPSAIIIAKTNASVKAAGILTKTLGGTYANLDDKSFGALGNLIYWQVKSSQAEVAPTTGSFTYIPPVGTVGIDVRVNGGSATTVNLSANEQPGAFVSDIAVSGVTAVGGVARGLVSVSGTLAVVANPSSMGATVIQLTRSVNWAVAPVVGDTLIIPTGSAVAGGGANIGAYVVTQVGAATLFATKMSDAGHGGAVPGVITNPTSVSATSILATTDADVYSPVTISVTSGSVIDGVGKALEIAQLTSGSDLLSRCLLVLGTTGVVSWISKSGSPQLLVSAAELKVDLNVNRQFDNVTEDLVAGGAIPLQVGYLGTSGTLTIANGVLTTTVVGGSGGSLSLQLSQFPSISDLASYINAQTGYKAVVGSGVLGQLPVSALDQVSGVGIGSDFGALPGRIKNDASAFFGVVSSQSVLVQLNNPPAQAAAGLPALTTAFAYLSGGARGGSASADFTAAIDALQNVTGNFLVPLISQDATRDIAAGLTDSSSTYQIDSVNAYAKTHVLAMSTLKKRKNRQAFCSKEDTFVNCQNAAGNLASFRVSLAFEDFKQVASSGNLVQFQPWIGACLAAGMQAAGFYRAIFNKGINTSGVVSLAGDFNPRNDSQVEQALQAGLLPARPALGGGFSWVSDQTTYGKDNNFVFNSIQAVYVADIVALSTSQFMEKAFVGQSVADISAAVALSALEAKMAQFLALKLIAPSDDAPKGFKNASITINGPAMIVSVEIKLAGAIYFIPISFLVSPVQQSANG